MGDRIEQYEIASLALRNSIPVAGEPDGLASTQVLPRAPCHGCAAD
jgi:hypothetical protein